MVTDKDVASYFGNTVSSDLLRMVCGFDEIGNGSDRAVYPCLIDPSLVIKVEVTAGSFQNVKEWQTWDELKEHKPVAHWLAPCVFISACGSILAMKRTKTLDHDHYPSTLPQFLSDPKYSNYGMYEGHFVCHDYGTSLLASWGPGTTKKRKTNWRE